LIGKRMPLLALHSIHQSTGLDHAYVSSASRNQGVGGGRYAPLGGGGYVPAGGGGYALDGGGV